MTGRDSKTSIHSAGRTYDLPDPDQYEAAVAAGVVSPVSPRAVPMTGRELLGQAMDEFIAGGYSATADTPSGAELIRRADAEPVLRAALSPESLHKALVAAVRSRYALTDREIAERMSAALLTTPDAPG